MPRNPEPAKSKVFEVFESALLIICLCVLALRATYLETHFTAIANPRQALSNSAFSLLISAVLIFSALAWLIVLFCRRKFPWRFSGIEIGLLIFLAAAIVSYPAAANKRLAINDFLALAAPILTAVVLIQILNSPSRIKLLLLVIISAGVVTTFQCANQLFADNQIMIDDYIQNPEKYLDSQGIAEGSLKQFQFEHRLYSKDIRGFLTTSNSTGSFLIFSAFAAVALFIEKLKNYAAGSSRIPLVIYALAAAVTTAGLVITQSKGALAAAFIAAVMFTAYLCLGKRLRQYRKAILIICLLLVIVAAAVIISYGLKHESLPGGNSMLVRWQYWTAAAKIYAGHPVTGVGGGNFATNYLHYKIAAAPEEVKSPHNFLLSLITQYGPLGLIGFMAAFLIPLYRIFFATTTENQPMQTGDKPSIRLTTAAIFSISLVLLILRPILTADEVGSQWLVIFYVILKLYITPACIFILAFWFLFKTSSAPAGSEHKQNGTTAAALFCAVIAVAIHNLIDFAIFEPAVLTCFWAIIACMTAISFQHNNLKTLTFAPPKTTRIASIAAALLLTFALTVYALAPAIKSGRKTQLAIRNFAHTHELLDNAAADDPLDPAPANLNGRAYIQHYRQTGNKDAALLEAAAECFTEAAKRDSDNFKNYEKLSDIYTMLAETSSPDTQTHHLQKARDFAERAVKRYPGSDRLHFKLAQLADHLDETTTALDHYKKTVQIEDSFAIQFRSMYPDREIFSRLGQQKYQLAKQRIIELEKQGH
jgi:hypothetical protein